MELLLHDQVFGALVFLAAGQTATVRQCLVSPQNTSELGMHGMFTILWTISMSSLRASWTPLGSPSILTSPLRSESWGIRTDTLYCSLIRLTGQQQEGNTHSFISFMELI